jgi:hypothetical protein
LCRRRDASNRPEDPSVVYEGIQIEGTVNIDWEDIAIDGDTLYIADVGNNANARRDLAVYAVKEPNPEATLQAHALKRIPVAYLRPESVPRRTVALRLRGGVRVSRQALLHHQAPRPAPAERFLSQARLSIGWTRCIPTA